jgi:hypothetical protein
MSVPPAPKSMENASVVSLASILSNRHLGVLGQNSIPLHSSETKIPQWSTASAFRHSEFFLLYIRSRSLLCWTLGAKIRGGPALVRRPGRPGVTPSSRNRRAYGTFMVLGFSKRLMALWPPTLGYENYRQGHQGRTLLVKPGSIQRDRDKKVYLARAVHICKDPIWPS